MTIDTGLSTTSTNPVQNKVVTQALGTRAPLSDLEAVQQTVSQLSASLAAESTERSAQYTQLLTSLQSYANQKIAEANWMTRNDIIAFVDDEITSMISEHNVSATAHADIRALLNDTVTLAAFNAHTDGGYNPVTELNDALHVTLSEKTDWNAAVMAIDDHLDVLTVDIIHITQEERVKWNSATTDLANHIVNQFIHVTESEVETWTNAAEGFAAHTADVTAGYDSPHVTYADRVKWDKVVTDLTAHIADSVNSASPHLHAGERATWNAAIVDLASHVASSDIHITALMRTQWDTARAAANSHLAITSGNPHGTTAADLDAYTTTQVDTKISNTRTQLLSDAQSSVNALLAGGIRYRGTVGTVSELMSMTGYVHGDAFIVTDDPGYSYIDVDGTTKYQACIYICQVTDGSPSWVAFSEPFKINLNTFDTKASANTRIATAINVHDTDPSAHSTVFAAIQSAASDRMGDIEDDLDTLSSQSLPKSTFQTHANNKSNPHQVTAEDVGTLTSSEIATLVDAAEADVEVYAEQKIGSMVASTFKWRGTFEFPAAGSGIADPLVTMSKRSTAWHRGTANAETDNPAFGDCYTEQGSARMYVFTGIPMDVDVNTEPAPTSAADYARFGWDDVGNILDTNSILSEALSKITELIAIHDGDTDAHQTIQSSIADFTGDITVGGETFHGIIDALTTVISRYQALGTVRQTASLVELVNNLYDQYTNKQNKITAGLAIKLNEFDAGGNPVTYSGDVPSAPVATTQIAWDPTDMLGDGLVFSDGMLKCSYNTVTRTVHDPVTDEDITTTHVVLGEAYATLDWVSTYTAGLMTRTAVANALAGKQDRLTTGTGIAIYSVMDTSHNAIKYDEGGNIVYKKTQQLDDFGQPVYTEDGDPIFVNVQKRDDNGNLMFDQGGNPIYEEAEDEDTVVADETHLEISTIAEDEQVLELTVLRLQDHVTGEWHEIRIDEDGDLTSVRV